MSVRVRVCACVRTHGMCVSGCACAYVRACEGALKTILASIRFSVLW